MWNSNSGASFEGAPKGVHGARCIKIIDLGTQKGEYQGQETIRRQNLVTWELPDELRDDGKPFTISKFYTASLGDKANLFQDLTNWLGDGFYELDGTDRVFDPKTLLGKACQVTIVEREKSGKRVVSGVTGVPKSMKVPEPVNDLVYFSLNKGEFDENVFNDISEGLRKMIVKSPEYEAIYAGTDTAGASGGADDAEIPF